MEHNFLCSSTSRINEHNTCKQYGVTDLGIVAQALKTSLPFFLLRLTLDSKSYNCFYAEVDVAQCTWWLAYGLNEIDWIPLIGQSSFSCPTRPFWLSGYASFTGRTGFCFNGKNVLHVEGKSKNTFSAIVEN